MTQRTRRRLWVAGITLVCLSALYFTAAAVLARMIHHRLQAMVSAHLNADLRLGNVSYHFPYGVSIDDASVVAPGADGQPLELFKVRHVELALAEMPVGS